MYWPDQAKLDWAFFQNFCVFFSWCLFLLLFIAAAESVMSAITLHESTGSPCTICTGAPTLPSWTREIIWAWTLFCHGRTLHVKYWVLWLIFSIILIQLSLLDNFIPINPTPNSNNFIMEGLYQNVCIDRVSNSGGKCGPFVKRNYKMKGFAHPGYDNSNLLRWKNKQFVWSVSPYQRSARLRFCGKLWLYTGKFFPFFLAVFRGIVQPTT